MSGKNLTTTSRLAKDSTPAIGQMRLADPLDAPRILGLCNDAMKDTFRVSKVEEIENLIETAVLSITQLNVRNELIGFLCLNNYPLIPSVAPPAWEVYIWTKYKQTDLKPRNTLWIHLLCFTRRYNRDAVDAMLKSVYMHDSYLQYICMTKSILGCPQLMPGISRSEASFRRVQAMERGIPGDQLPALLIADRKDVWPMLRVRRAVEEDNDDIVPIVDRNSERLRDLYGDYYVSELVSRHPDSERSLLVCEHKEVAVGVMSLNTDINFASLEECFELAPYAGLRKLDSMTKKVDRKISHHLSSTNEMNDDMADPCRSNESTTNVTPKQHSDLKIDETKSYLESKMVYTDDLKFMNSLDLLDYLDLCEDEEEEEDYDIVNIDPELLSFPYSPTYHETSPVEADVNDPLNDSALFKQEKHSSQTADNITRYSGASNAFLLEMCAMHHEYDDRYAFDMLMAAYDMFPDRDYCVMCLPSSHAPFPLLEHFTLVTPHNTRMRFVKESLYVAHLNSVKGAVSVRPGEPADRPAVLDLFERTTKFDTAQALFEESLWSLNVKSYMLMAEAQPIGIIITGPFEDSLTIRSKFDLKPESYESLADGVILIASLSPVLEPHARWYMRDVLRQSQYCSLFWTCQTIGKGENDPLRNIMPFAERMVPVRPRMALPNLTGQKNVDKTFKNISTPFALWTIERPLTSLPKVFVNNSIVVIGASRTGLAFIEKLILGPSSEYLTFANLTLISQYGLPTVVDCLEASRKAIPRPGRYTDQYLKSVPFCFYVDVIPDVLISIDRKNKSVHVKGGGLKYYDELVITCGEQFQHPDYLKESLETVKILQDGLPCERMLMDNPKYQPDRVPPPPPIPDNLFLINSLLEANITFRKLAKMISLYRKVLSESRRIVVYGDRLEAYCCISALLELGVSGKEIAFIENFPPEDDKACRINCFNDELIDDRVQKQLNVLGVKCYRNTRIAKLNITSNIVKSLSILDPLHLATISCFALFYYGLKAINIDAFKAINECGLVYDGGLVVSPTFETNDPNIFGAGTCCTYSRSLYASRYNHSNYNSEDVGEALADFFLRRFDPFIRCHSNYDTKDLMPRYNSTLYCRSHASIPEVNISRIIFTQQPVGRRWQPVLKFDSPIAQIATLPGPLYYLKVRKPGLDIPMEVQINLPHQGHVLTTDQYENYFRLRLSVLHCVDAITCLSKEPFSGELFTLLYGKHEAFFNKLILRYKMEEIDDLYEYFTQPWLSAFYQETFSDLMYTIANHDVGTIYERLLSTLEMTTDEAKASSSMMREKAKASSLLARDWTSSGRAREDTKTSSDMMKADPNRSSFVMKAEDKEPCVFPSSKISWASKMTSTFSTFSECQIPDVMPTWTLGELMKKYAADSSAEYEKSKWPADIPTECGQNNEVHSDVGSFWHTLDGDDIAVEQTAKHLNKYAVSNPQYASGHIDLS